MCDKAFIIAKNPKYDGHRCVLASMVYKFFNKKTSAMHARSETLATRARRATRNKFAGSAIKNENTSDQQLAEEFHKPIIKKF